jgi:nucleotide-binding universal stress UspA family protein
MFRKILIPLDGSVVAEQALPLALSVARRAEAGLEVVHVHVPLAPLYTEPRPNMETPLDTRARRQARAYLEGAARRVRARVKVAVNTTFLEGVVAETLQAHAAAAGVDLIVMTTHGRGPLNRLWLGSVADELLRKSSIPLLLIRPRQAEVDLASDPVLRRVLIPLDGSPLAERVLEPALDLGGLMGAEYTLLRVVQPVLYAAPALGGLDPGWADTGLTEELQAQAREYLDGVAKRLRERSLSAHPVVTFDPSPAGAVLEEAQARGSDLIALATHGRGGLRRAVLGSVADKVIRGSTSAVLVYHPVET